MTSNVFHCKDKQTNILFIQNWKMSVNLLFFVTEVHDKNQLFLMNISAVFKSSFLLQHNSIKYKFK